MENSIKEEEKSSKKTEQKLEIVSFPVVTNGPMLRFERMPSITISPEKQQNRVKGNIRLNFVSIFLIKKSSIFH